MLGRAICAPQPSFASLRIALLCAVQAQAMDTMKSRGEKIQILQKHLFPKTFQLLKTIGEEKYYHLRASPDSFILCAAHNNLQMHFAPVPLVHKRK